MGVKCLAVILDRIYREKYKTKERLFKMRRSRCLETRSGTALLIIDQLPCRTCRFEIFAIHIEQLRLRRRVLALHEFEGLAECPGLISHDGHTIILELVIFDGEKYVSAICTVRLKPEAPFLAHGSATALNFEEAVFLASLAS